VNLELPVGDVWGEARLVLPADLAGRYRNLLTGKAVETTGAIEARRSRCPMPSGTPLWQCSGSRLEP
jgi:hypothetical protein